MFSDTYKAFEGSKYSGRKLWKGRKADEIELTLSTKLFQTGEQIRVDILLYGAGRKLLTLTSHRVDDPSSMAATLTFVLKNKIEPMHNAQRNLLNHNLKIESAIGVKMVRIGENLGYPKQLRMKLIVKPFQLESRVAN